MSNKGARALDIEVYAPFALKGHTYADKPEAQGNTVPRSWLYTRTHLNRYPALRDVVEPDMGPAQGEIKVKKEFSKDGVVFIEQRMDSV